MILLMKPSIVTAQQTSVNEILAEMSPEERVGQLFLVTFYGTDISEESDIAALITEHHVGGVVLLRENDNFTDVDPIEITTQELILGLQQINAPEASGPFSALSGPNQFIPLFVGIEFEPGAQANPQLLSGATTLPTNMSIGATWNETLAGDVGRIVGAELSALGFNLLIGPSADVLRNPSSSLDNGLSTNVFGGQPYWVSEMSSAYVQGVHIGSQDRVLVVPQHFPGFGSADRIPDDEIPSLRLDLPQLMETELVPFLALTGGAPVPNSAADGLMTAHLRYIGLQPDAPGTQNRPLSLDAASLQVVLEVDEVALWRDAGGLLMTDSLGARGVTAVYDPSAASFSNRQIAQNALSAGNDILYMRDFGLNPPVDQTENIIDTIEAFVQQYKDNDAFREQVDASVRRILEKKLSVYEQFSEEAVLGQVAVDMPEQQPDLTRSIAQQSVTLLSPSQPDSLTGPQAGERIVVFTETRPIQQCSECLAKNTIELEAFEASVLRFFGPQSVNIVAFADIQSFSFAELETFLNDEETVGLPLNQNGEDDEPSALSIALNAADWVVFLMLEDESVSRAEGQGVVSRFLVDRTASDAQRFVVMAMGAPYLLDSTEMSKLTSMFALYGHSEPYIDVAARALFQDIAYAGSSPVSISGMNYSIDEAVRPDPDQTINLTLIIERGETGQVVSDARVQEGDTLRVRTGQILDSNGNPVPDGTPVDFVIDYVDDTVRDVVTGVVSNGSAEVQYLIQRSGDLLITASSDPAQSSSTIRIIGGIPETPVPPTPIPTPPPPVEPELPDTQDASGQIASVNFSDLFFSLLGLLTITLAIFFWVSESRGLNYGLLLALPSFVFGLIAYNYYVLLLPGAAFWNSLFGDGWAASVAAWAGAVVGFSLILLILNLRRRQLQR